MKQLETDFIGRGEVKGFKFTQLKKTEYGYIYAVDTKDKVHFEVFKHKENNRFNCVSYPKTNSFGVWAWTFVTFERACEALEELKTQRYE